MKKEPRNFIIFVLAIFVLFSGFKPEHAEATDTYTYGNTYGTTYTNTGTNTNTNTNTQTNTYTYNGEVLTSYENKITRYTVTTMVNGVEQTSTIVDDGIMLKYDDGLGVMSYLIPGDGQMLFLQETLSPESGNEATVLAKWENPFRGLTLKTDDGAGNFVDVGNDSGLIDPNRRPVVITHGYGGIIKSLFGFHGSSYEDMLALGDKYDPAKYQVFYADYGSYWGIDDIAKDLADKVNNNLLQFYSGKVPIIFEQHSMGCAVVYYDLANELFDMSKIDTVLMISIAPLYGSFGKPEDINFLLRWYSGALADGNTAAFFADMKRKGLGENVTLIVIGGGDGINSTRQQLNFGYDGFFPVVDTHTGILTNKAVDSITAPYLNYDGTFIQKVGNWNISYEHGKLTTLYYDDFYGPGGGIALLADDTGNFTGGFGFSYTGSYSDGSGLIVNEDFFPITYNSDGGWDEETTFGIQHFDSEGIAIGYTITTGVVDPIVITLNDTEQSYTVVYKKVGTTPVDLSSDTTPPTAPGTPTAPSLNTGTFTVSWNASSDGSGIYKYLVYRGGATGSKSLIATVTTNSYNESYLPAGKYRYCVTAVDKAGWHSNSTDSAVIEVGEGNRPPVLAAIGGKKAYAGNNLTFTVSAIDHNGDPKWYRATGLPAGAVFDGRTFSWTPALSQVGNYSVTFFVTDGFLSDSETITIAVNVNHPPVLAAIGNKSVNEGSNLTFTVGATDPDGDPLTYNASGLPTGATFDSGTRTFSWTPTFSQAGNYNVPFIASDGSLTDAETVVITVGMVNDVTLSSQTINGGVVQYRAQNSITAGPVFVVEGAADVTFKAGAVITLKPGFRAMAGSKFRAVPNLN